MKIELRKFISNERFSEETLMFRADIYVDGKRAGTCGNDGRGGSTDVHFIDAATAKRVREHLKTVPPHDDPYWHSSVSECFLGLREEAAGQSDVIALVESIHVHYTDWEFALAKVKAFMLTPRSVENGGLLAPETRLLLERLERTLDGGPYFRVTEDSFFSDLAADANKAKGDKRIARWIEKQAKAVVAKGLQPRRFTVNDGRTESVVVMGFKNPCTAAEIEATIKRLAAKYKGTVTGGEAVAL